MFYFGRRAPDRFVPQALVGPFHRFAVLVGLAFLVGTVTPSTVGAYPGSVAAAHGGRLFPYALALLVGLLGLQIGEERWGLPYATRSPPRQFAQLAGLGAFGLGLAGPFLVAYRAWTAAPWAGWALSAAFLAIVLGCCVVAGAGLTAVIPLDERRFVAKYALLALIMLAPLLAPIPLSPLVAVVEIWEGEAVRAAPGLALPVGVALLSLGVMTWKARVASSVARGDGTGPASRSGLP